MTYLEKYIQEHPDYKCREDYVINVKCPFNNVPIRCLIPCRECWNQEIPETEKTEETGLFVGDERVEHPDTDSSSSIKDSGDRTEFATGAVRDMREGKGRCDLMPLDVVAAYMGEYENTVDPVLMGIYMFQKNNTASHLYCALNDFCREAYLGNEQTMFLEVAKHFEEGAKKYGENNWQKGIPTWCYIDSAVRHYLKWLRGDKDEPHDRAFVWNLLCCIWTIKHEAELKIAQ